jgi:single-strand DNA-binding protein
MNRVILLGNIGGEIEKKEVGEHEVYNFTMATNKVIKKEKKTQWHKCKAWNKTGKFISDHFGKGDAILVEGEIEYRTYEKDGETKYITEINITQAYFTGAKKSEKKESDEGGGW